MEYSNFGYATLGRIVSNVSGTRYEDYIRRELMMPLGMASTGYDVLASPPERRAIGYRWQDNGWVREPDMRDGAFGAMGGVETSANDYAKWVAFLLSAWPARDGPDAGPVRRSTVREIVTGANFVSGSMRNPAAGGSPCRDAIAYGMAWRVVDDCDLGRIVTHTGGYPGYGSVVMLLPGQGRRPVRLQQQDLRRRFATDPARGAGAAKGGLPHRPGITLSAGLASAYDAARAVWAKGDIGAAPLANNMLMDRDSERWKTMLAELKAEVGECRVDEPIRPFRRWRAGSTGAARTAGSAAASSAPRPIRSPCRRSNSVPRPREPTGACALHISPLNAAVLTRVGV